MKHQAVFVRGGQHFLAWALFTLKIEGSATIGKVGFIGDEIMAAF